jgi:hypothetical protein
VKQEKWHNNNSNIKGTYISCKFWVVGFEIELKLLVEFGELSLGKG